MGMQLPKIIAAPMAGGPSTPALVNAVTFGFLAFGTCSVSQAREELAEVTGNFGVNFFMPQRIAPDQRDVRALAAELGVEVPDVDLSCGFEDKFAIALEAGPAVVSSTFGCFSEREIQRAHNAGAQAWATVTNEEEAKVAVARGVDALVVQGISAGGHRATWSPNETPDPRDTLELVRVLKDIRVPIIAAGGARTPYDVDRLIEAGATAVSCGSIFLMTDEAGTSLRNRELLQSDRSTIASRAFSGRVARGIQSAFTDEYPDLPPLYPYLRPMTSENDYCLVGARRGTLPTGPAAAVEAWMAGTGKLR